MIKKIPIVCLILLTACAVGPDYVRPKTVVPEKYKETPKNWKIAKPQDECNRGQWWKIFNDSQLNTLEEALNNSNQTIATAVANYFNARALVDEARAAFFPTLTATAAVNRQKIGSSNASSNSSNSSNTSTNTTTSTNSNGSVTGSASGSSLSNPFNSHSFVLDASWEPDLWGSVRRSVEASVAGADSSAALLANTRLSQQALLAQTYFQLRALDEDQKILNDTVMADQQLLKLTINRYHSGVAALSDIVQARTQLEAAQAAAINNGINRAQFEHAIAVLMGEPPEELSIPPHPLITPPPPVPIQVPSELLERRPDIASAERLIVQANAEVGVAISAYFPTLTLSATGTFQNRGLTNWFSLPNLSWSLGSQLAETLLDGGLRSATIAAARATYEANVATYRQTVLAAFQDVEDNLSSLRILAAEQIVQDKASADAQLALKLVINEYKAGTVDYLSVIAAQTIANTAEKNAADIIGLRMTSTVGLIKALGGGWDISLSFQ